MRQASVRAASDKRGQVLAAGRLPTHDHGKRVVEAERVQPFQAPLAAVGGAHLLQNRLRRPSRRRLFQNGRQSRPRVLRVQIDLAFHQRLMRHQRSAQIELPLHRHAQAPLDLLRQHLSQHNLFRKILRPHHDPRRMRTPRQPCANTIATAGARRLICLIAPPLPPIASAPSIPAPHPPPGPWRPPEPRPPARSTCRTWRCRGK